MESAEVTLSVLVPILVILLVRAFKNSTDIASMRKTVKDFCSQRDDRIDGLARCYRQMSKRLTKIERLIAKFHSEEEPNGKGSEGYKETGSGREEEPS